jgi:transposase-like protein
MVETAPNPPEPQSDHIALSSEESGELERISTDERVDAEIRIRAGIIIDQATGVPFVQTCERFRISRASVYKWRRRFKAHGLPGITTKSWGVTSPHTKLDRTLAKLPGNGAEATPADVKRAIVAFMAELPDDDPRSPHAPRAKVKLGALTLLARIASTEAKSGNEKEADQTLSLLETLRDEADAIAEMPAREPPTLEDIVFDLAK